MNLPDEMKMNHSSTVSAPENGVDQTGHIPGAILDALPGAVVYCDHEFTVRYYNAAAATCLTGIANGQSLIALVGETAFAALKEVWSQPGKRKVKVKSQSSKADHFFNVTVSRENELKGKSAGYILLFEQDHPGEHYRFLLDNLPAAIYTCDRNGYITHYNRAAVMLWGREPVLGKDMWCGSWKIFHPDGITPMELDSCPMAVALKDGRPVTGQDIIIERPDGLRREIEPYPVPLLDEKGNVTGAVNMLIDVTERKNAETKLGHLAAIVRSSNDPIISKTLDGIITSWNDAAQKVFGYTADEMIGQHITKLIPEDRIDEEPRILERLKRGDVVEHFETKRITKSGEVLDISLTISPVKNSRGKVIGASKIARDITAQKKLVEALQKSEERLRMASESTQLGTWEMDPATKVVYWSDECRKIFGIAEPGALTSTVIAEQTLPEDRGYIDNMLAGAMDPAVSDYFNVEYRIRRKNDNAIRWLKVRAKMHFDENGNPQRFIGTLHDFTEEKEREQTIRENEERLRMAIQSTRLGTWEYQPVTGLLNWSDRCRALYGVPEDKEINLEFFERQLHPEDAVPVMEALNAAIDPGGNGQFDFQFRIIRFNDNQVRWVHSQGKASFSKQGVAERFIGTIHDITEEKNQEEELRNSVELFTTMADNVPAMIWMSGDDKFQDFFNKTWLEFTGRTIEEESNEGWLENVHPDDVQRCIENYNKSFNEQHGFYTEYRLRRHDGVYRWVADSSVPRYNMDGSFAGFISACIDIDDQKNYREKIQASELRLQTISNAAPVGLWMTDASMQIIFVNETWISWTGKPFHEQAGEGWVAGILEEDRGNAMAKLKESFEKRVKYSTEFRIRRIDGDLRWCLTEGYPHFDISGAFAGYAGSITDITEIKKMEERKDDFIKMASHELKTPITSIKGYVQLLLNIYNEINEEKFQAARATVRSSLQTISKQVNKLTRLVSELLDLTRIESGKLELYKTEFDLGNLVEETVQDVRLTTTNHAIIIHNDFEGSVYADKDRLSQVLLNLLTNAIKYSPDADVVEVFISNVNGHAQIKVKDSGIGIDTRDQSRIFERFYRVEGKSEQTFPGFGIGLFIASEIIARHNGTIQVDSARGKGSVFTVTLPLSTRK